MKVLFSWLLKLKITEFMRAERSVINLHNALEHRLGRFNFIHNGGVCRQKFKFSFLIELNNYERIILS